ncbi:hypothetical protein ACFL21_02555 [Patescibacteria group bacterium]
MDGDAIRRTFNKLTKKEIEEMNEKTLSDSKRDFEVFKQALEKGQCCYCNDSIESFDESIPCFHWFLRPNGCDKKHIGQLLEQSGIGYFRILSYLRWIANIEIPGANINDLAEEVSSSKKIELTIQYDNYEWSFSCAPNDFDGHKEKNLGTSPHYHFAMKIGGRTFIKFGDFHAQFIDEDLFNFKAMEIEVMKQRELYGASVQDFIGAMDPEELADMMISSEPEKAAFNLQSIIMSEPEKPISGDFIAEMIKESKERKIPIAKIAKEKGLSIKTFISPGEGIPKMFKRKPRNGGV